MSSVWPWKDQKKTKKNGQLSKFCRKAMKLAAEVNSRKKDNSMFHCWGQMIILGEEKHRSEESGKSCAAMLLSRWEEWDWTRRWRDCCRTDGRGPQEHLERKNTWAQVRKLDRSGGTCLWNFFSSSFYLLGKVGSKVFHLRDERKKCWRFQRKEWELGVGGRREMPGKSTLIARQHSGATWGLHSYTSSKTSHHNFVSIQEVQAQGQRRVEYNKARGGKGAGWAGPQNSSWVKREESEEQWKGAWWIVSLCGIQQLLTSEENQRDWTEVREKLQSQVMIVSLGIRGWHRGQGDRRESTVYFFKCQELKQWKGWRE